MAFDYTVFTVYGNAGEVSYMLLRTCKLIKKCSFSTILISYQSKCQRFTVR